MYYIREDMNYKNRKAHSERMKGNKLFQGKTHSEKTKKKMSDNQTGNKNSCWKGGRCINQGYVSIHSPNHPNKDINGRVKEERLVMETHLGRYLLKEEIIHHINKIRNDNRIENLQIVSAKEHAMIHRPRKGIPNSKETRQKISKALKGRKLSQEHKQAISAGGAGRPLGYICSEETRIKMSISRKKYIPTEEHKRKQSEGVQKYWNKVKKGEINDPRYPHN